MEIFHVIIIIGLIVYLLGRKVTLFKPLVDLNINCLQLCIAQMKSMCYICKRTRVQKNIHNGKQRKVLQKIAENI